MSTPIEKCLDTYAVSFGRGPEAEQRLFDEVKEMEANSKWLDGIGSKTLKLTPVSAPLFADDVANTYGLDIDITRDTSMDNGTRLIIHRTYNDAIVWSMCVRSTARGTLCETAKLNGSALSRMGADKLAETLNNGLEVARGTSLLLERYGKISAVHSDAAGGYKVMPISELLDIVKKEVSSKFGRMQFVSGHNQHSYTSAVWLLPEAKKDLIAAYEKALSHAVSNRYPINAFTPAIRFYASDTAASVARVIPIFMASNGAEIRLVDGVQVKHERRVKKSTDSGAQQMMLGTTVTSSGITGVVQAGVGASAPTPVNKKDELDGVELFEAEVKDLYAMFTDAVEKAGELSKIEIWFAENCVVSLCKKFNIPKKYGDAAREEVRNFSIASPCLTAHDVYLAMNRVVVEAINTGASSTTINFLSEAVARVLNVTDWDEHNVGGVVTW